MLTHQEKGNKEQVPSMPGDADGRADWLRNTSVTMMCRCHHKRSARARMLKSSVTLYLQADELQLSLCQLISCSCAWTGQEVPTGQLTAGHWCQLYPRALPEKGFNVQFQHVAASHEIEAGFGGSF